jgi:hypothetical protein
MRALLAGAAMPRSKFGDWPTPVTPAVERVRLVAAGDWAGVSPALLAALSAGTSRFTGEATLLAIAAARDGARVGCEATFIPGLPESARRAIAAVEAAADEEVEVLLDSVEARTGAETAPRATLVGAGLD